MGEEDVLGALSSGSMVRSAERRMVVVRERRASVPRLEADASLLSKRNSSWIIRGYCIALLSSNTKERTDVLAPVPDNKRVLCSWR